MIRNKERVLHRHPFSFPTQLYPQKKPVVFDQLFSSPGSPDAHRENLRPTD